MNKLILVLFALLLFAVLPGCANSGEIEMLPLPIEQLSVEEKKELVGSLQEDIRRFFYVGKDQGGNLILGNYLTGYRLEVGQTSEFAGLNHGCDLVFYSVGKFIYRYSVFQERSDLLHIANVDLSNFYSIEEGMAIIIEESDGRVYRMDSSTYRVVAISDVSSIEGQKQLDIRETNGDTIQDFCLREVKND